MGGRSGSKICSLINRFPGGIRKLCPPAHNVILQTRICISGDNGSIAVATDRKACQTDNHRATFSHDVANPMVTVNNESPA
jgi:hypothetical protein